MDLQQLFRRTAALLLLLRLAALLLSLSKDLFEASDIGEHYVAHRTLDFAVGTVSVRKEMPRHQIIRVSVQCFHVDRVRHDDGLGRRPFILIERECLWGRTRQGIDDPVVDDAEVVRRFGFSHEFLQSRYAEVRLRKHNANCRRFVANNAKRHLSVVMRRTAGSILQIDSPGDITMGVNRSNSCERLLAW